MKEVGILKKIITDETYSNIKKESFKELSKSHFPAATSLQYTEDLRSPALRYSQIRPGFKAPGVNGIYPILLQMEIDVLIKIFKVSDL